MNLQVLFIEKWLTWDSAQVWGRLNTADTTYSSYTSPFIPIYAPKVPYLVRCQSCTPFLKLPYVGANPKGPRTQIIGNSVPDTSHIIQYLGPKTLLLGSYIPLYSPHISPYNPRLFWVLGPLGQGFAMIAAWNSTYGTLRCGDGYGASKQWGGGPRV